MKRYIPLAVTCLTLVMLSSSASLAIFPGRITGTNPFPGISYGFNNRVGDGLVWVQLQRGWVLGVQAWYACFATNNIRMAQTQTVTLAPYYVGVAVVPRGEAQSLTLAPKLTSAIGAGAQPMYIVTNFNNNGPVFSTSPLTVAPYTGLWEVIYITWNPGVTPWVITNTAAPAGAPPGLPDATQATFSSLPPGSIDPNAVATVLDCPIFAVGQISNPWFKPNDCPPPPIVYRIPQGIFLDYTTKQLLIPYWEVYCQDDITRRISVRDIIIPDASDPTIAAVTGANYAPALANVPIPDRSNLFVFNWQQDLNPDPCVVQLLKVLTNQYPLLDDCPSTCARPIRNQGPGTRQNSNGYGYCGPDCGWRNTNFGYSPVDSFVLLNRDINLISPEVLFNNVPFLLQQLNRGALIPAPPFNYPPGPLAPAVNAPVICISSPLLGG